MEITLLLSDAVNRPRILKRGAMQLARFSAALALCAVGVQAATEGTLARFNGGQIVVADMEAAIGNKDPRTRLRLATAEGRLSFLRDLENYDLLAIEAERRGYATHPAVVHAKRRAAIDVMLATESRVAPASIPEPEVEREFAARSASTTKPASLRLPDAEGKVRRALAAQKSAQAQSEFVKHLYEQYHPEIHAELVGLVTFGPLKLPDQPQGFPAAPPDPRAPPRLVEPDEF